MTDNNDDDKRGKGPRAPGGSKRGTGDAKSRDFKSRDTMSRGDKPRDFKPRGDKPFGAKPSGDRPFKPRFERDGAAGGDKRPYTPRSDRPAGDRPAGDKPAGNRAFGDRPPRRDDGGERPFKPRGEFNPRGDDKPRGPFKPRDSFKPRDDRPAGDRPYGDRPARSDAPRFDRENSGPGEKRPFAPRGRRQADDRPPADKPHGERSYGGKPSGDRSFKPRGDFKPRDDRSSDKPRFDSRSNAGGERTLTRSHDQKLARDQKPVATVAGPGEGDRIAKVMARAGLCSRRDAEEWIAAGRVRVNGTIIDSPALDITPGDKVEVDGAPLPEKERTRLWLFHKPKGLVTTESDPEGRPTVFDNLPAGLPRVLSIGRLDINTEGLLLLTNDGGLARVLAHPKTAWLRRYRVRVHGETDQARLDTLRDGVTIEHPEDGPVEYGPIVAKLERSRGTNSWLVMDLREGKNREIKRILEHIGLQVSRLIRVSFGPFQLGELEEGAVEEIRGRMLQDQLGERLAEEAGVDFDAPRFDYGTRPAQPERAPREPDFDESHDRPVRRDWDFTDAEPRPNRSPPGARDLRKPGRKRDQALMGNSPHLKVEHEKVADRKGREVKVERIVTIPQEREETVWKPAVRGDRKSFGAKPFRDGKPSGKSFGDRPRVDRGGAESGAKRGYKPRFDQGSSEGGERPFKPRDDRPSGDRPSRPYTPRDGESGERSFKPRFDRGDSSTGEKRPYTPREDRSSGDRSSGDRPSREKPASDRFGGERSGGYRSGSDRPARSFSPRDGEGEKRPYTPRGDRPSGDRSSSDKPYGGKSFGDRPPRGDGKSFDKPRSEGFKPRGEFKPRGDFKPGGSKGPGGPKGSGGPKRPGGGSRPGGSGGKGADRRR